MSEKTLTFEQASEQLEQILKQLENGNLTLDESVKLFEKAQELLNVCNTHFDIAKGKLTIIKNNLEEFLDKSEL